LKNRVGYVPLDACNVLGIIFCCLTNIRERQIKALRALYKHQVEHTFNSLCYHLIW